MLGALQKMFGRGDAAPSDLSGGVPADLALAIEAASVTNRGEPDPETGDVRVMVRAAGLGAFYFEGIDPTAERIARQWPNVSPQGARRAARLLASVVAAHNRDTYRRRDRRGGWVWDF